MADVFISYAGQDRATASALADALEAGGWTVWWDRGLVAGDEFAGVIQAELEASRCVVILWSQSAAQSRWVTAEGQRAFDADKAVPVMLDDRPLPLPISMIQASSLAKWNGMANDPTLDQLRDTIASYLDPSEHIATSPYPLFRCEALGDWACVAGGSDGLVRAWSLEQGHIALEWPGHGDVVTAVAWDGHDLLASGSADRSARVWSLSNADHVTTLLGHSGPIDGIAFSNGDVVTASADQTVRWWSPQSPSPLHSESTSEQLVCCGSSTRGGVVAAGGSGGSIFSFVDRSPKHIIPAAHQGPVFSVSLSSSGEQVLTTGADGLARLWDLSTGTVTSTLRGHRGAVLAGALGSGPTLGLAVTGSSDATVRLWNVETGEQLQQFAGLTGGAPGVALSPAGIAMFTSAGGQVRAVRLNDPVLQRGTENADDLTNTHLSGGAR